jgi:hypothetical protein
MNPQDAAAKKQIVGKISYRVKNGNYIKKAQKETRNQDAVWERVR